MAPPSKGRTRVLSPRMTSLSLTRTSIVRTTGFNVRWQKTRVVSKEMVWNGEEWLCRGLKNQRVVDGLENTFWYASAHCLNATLRVKPIEPRSSLTPWARVWNIEKCNRRGTLLRSRRAPFHNEKIVLRFLKPVIGPSAEILTAKPSLLSCNAAALRPPPVDPLGTFTIAPAVRTLPVRVRTVAPSIESNSCWNLRRCEP